jgi:phosphatidylinositol-bisphosphatase
MLKQLDTMENEQMPDAVISANTVNFGNVGYLVPQTRTLTLENTGRVMARWRFIPKLDERRVHKPWVVVVPVSGIMLPGEKTPIRVTITVDNETAPALNTGADRLDDILILHLENGKDHFITLTGQYMRSCFGMTLELLARYPHPVRTSDPLPDSSEDKLALPKELWRIVDYIYRRGMDVADIFSQSGTSDMDRIRECLDTGESFAA